MKALIAVVAVVVGCSANGAKGSSAPSGGGDAASIDATLACTGSGDKKWTATFTASKVDECVVHEKDATLDVRIGTLEQGITLHVVDYNGSGQYRIGSGAGQGSKLAVVAQGGVGDATSTSVDSSTADPCSASCTIDVGGDASATTLDVSCTKLTRVDSGACITCTPKTSTMVHATNVACRRE